jgi:hypothetical protein
VESSALKVQLQPEHVYAHRLRGNLEKVRLLCELVRKREKVKKEYVMLAGIIPQRFAQ